MLTRLDGEFSPRLLRSGTTEDGQRYLLIEWCQGRECMAAASTMRGGPMLESRRRLLLLCCTILDNYALLHARNVIHSDIHPRNVTSTATR